MSLCFHLFLSQPDVRGAAVSGSDFAAALWTLGPRLTQQICKSSSQCLWYFAKCRAKGTGETILPLSCPLNVGLVATFNPGWGKRKQDIFVKHEWICSLTVCSSSCWASLTFQKDKDRNEGDSGWGKCIYYNWLLKKREGTIPVTFYPGIHCLPGSHTHIHKESSSRESGTLKTVRGKKKQCVKTGNKSASSNTGHMHDITDNREFLLSPERASERSHPWQDGHTQWTAVNIRQNIFTIFKSWEKKT